jgi:hypothetical protein
MATTGLTFHTQIMQPQPGLVEDRSPTYDLPHLLKDYTRTERTLIVTAVSDSDTVVVGMGGGWILNHPDRGEALLVKAAEVNEPYRDTDLQRQLLELLSQSANRLGIYNIHVPPEFGALQTSASTISPLEVFAARVVPAKLLALPQCPVCFRRISFVHSLSIWNPLRVKCPTCGAPLKMSRLATTTYVISAPFGAVLAFVAIYMEETKRWVPSDSAVYFAVLAPMILLLAYCSWTRTKFSMKDPPAE